MSRFQSAHEKRRLQARSRERRLTLPTARQLPSAVCAALLVPALSNAAPAQPTWSVQEIPTFGRTASVAYGINSSGWVTGYATQADGSQRGYVWKLDGSMTIDPHTGWVQRRRPGNTEASGDWGMGRSGRSWLIR